MSHYDDIYLHDTAREDSEAEQERIDARLAELLADRDAVLEADEWMAGTLDYDGIDTDLADLWTLEPGAVFSSNAWRHLMTFAQQAHKARMAKLEDMAEKAVDEAAEFRPEVEA